MASSSWVGIDHGRPQTAMQLRLDADAAAHRALQQVAHAGDGVVEVEQFRLETLAARERQQLVGQLGAALRRACAYSRGAARIGRRCRAAASPRSRKPILPSTTVSRLLKSCATPEVSWPTASSRCICRKVDFDLFALLDLRQQLAVGGRQLGGAFLDVRFQLLVEPPAFVLPSAAAQPGLHHADQRGRVERPFEEGDIAEELRSAGPRPGCVRGRRRARSAG